MTDWIRLPATSVEAWTRGSTAAVRKDGSWDVMAWGMGEGKAEEVRGGMEETEERIQTEKGVN